MKQKFILIVSLVAGLLAAILSKAWIDSRNAEIQREIDRVYAKAERIEVVAAGRPLPSGTTIQQSDLGFVSILASSVSDDTILKSDYLRIVGRKLVRSLDTRNPVLWSYIDGGKQAFRGLSDEIQQKMRAVSIPVWAPPASPAWFAPATASTSSALRPARSERRRGRRTRDGHSPSFKTSPSSVSSDTSAPSATRARLRLQFGDAQVTPRERDPGLRPADEEQALPDAA